MHGRVCTEGPAPISYAVGAEDGGYVRYGGWFITAVLLSKKPTFLLFFFFVDFFHMLDGVGGYFPGALGSRFAVTMNGEMRGPGERDKKGKSRLCFTEQVEKGKITFSVLSHMLPTS